MSWGKGVEGRQNSNCVRQGIPRTGVKNPFSSVYDSCISSGNRYTKEQIQMFVNKGPHNIQKAQKLFSLGYNVIYKASNYLGFYSLPAE